MQVWEKSGGISGELEEKSNDGSQGEFRGFQCPAQSELLWQSWFDVWLSVSMCEIDNYVVVRFCELYCASVFNIEVTSPLCQ